LNSDLPPSNLGLVEKSKDLTQVVSF